MKHTPSEAMEGPGTVIEFWNGSPDDYGEGNVRTETPCADVQCASSLMSAAESQVEHSEEHFVEAIAEEGYRQVDNNSLVVPSSTIPVGGSVANTESRDDLPQSDDLSVCLTPADDLQMPDGMLEVSHEQMDSYIRGPLKMDKGTKLILYQGEYKNQKVEIKVYPKTEQREFLKVREMAYLRNTFILPLLGYTSSGFVMYPVMVRGNLAEVCVKLDWIERFPIMYHLIAGVAFLHSFKPGIRYEIFHGCIRAENIYLDQNLNARIGGFSEAIELRKKSASPCDISKDDAKRTDCLKDDIHSLALVLIFLLTSTEATDHLLWLPEANRLKSCKEFWDPDLWKCVQQCTRDEIGRLIVRCYEKRITAERLEINFKKLLVRYGISLFNLPDDRSNYCIYCCVNIKDDNPVPVPTSESCPDACPARRFCRICYQTSFRNTLYCPNHGPLKDQIPRKDVYAILLSGFEADRLKQNIFDGDVESMFNVITDPRIIGLSRDNVFKIGHNCTDKLKALHDALKFLKTKTVRMLIFYYSGHGNRGKDKDVDSDEVSDEDDDGVKDEDDSEASNRDDEKQNDVAVHKKDEDDKDSNSLFVIGEKRTGITDKGLCRLLTPFTQASLFVIMDCCFAERYKVLPEIRNKESHPEIFRVQLNGTGSLKSGQMSSRINSLFTCCLVLAMEGGFKCPPYLCDEFECEEGDSLRKSAAFSGYISLNNCHTFITQHMKIWDVDSNVVKNGLVDDIAIARYRDTPLGVFKYDIRGLIGILNVYHLQDSMDNMLQQLRDQIGSSRRLGPLKNMDYRCFKMVVPGIYGEREIQKKREVIRECSRGHVIVIRIRSTSQDLDRNRRVVRFYCDRYRFKKVLDKVQFYYKDFFKYGFEKTENMEEVQTAVIDSRIVEDPGLLQLQDVYCDHEGKDFIGLIVTSLTRAYNMASSNGDITGLRVRITPTLATLELEMTKH